MEQLVQPGFHGRGNAMTMKLLSVNDEPHARDAARQRVGHANGFAVAPFKILIGEREHRVYPLNAAEVEYVESDGNYVTIRSGNSQYIGRDSIKRLSAELADVGFLRIERSLLVNIRAVRFVEPVGRGRFAFTLSCGSCLRSSASYRDSILRVLPMRRLANCRT
jgi:DNA-binding LytR/AlgR family response regulator